MNSGVLPELRDVGEHRNLERARELAIFVERRERLGEDHVGARLDVGGGALDRGLLSLDGMRVGARHDDETGVAARIHGGADAVGHFRRRHEFLARPMAAALGLHLVLEVHARRARADELARGAGNRECGAETRVGIDEQRQVGRAADAPRVLADVIQARDAEVRQAERGIRDARAREVDGAEAGSLGEERAVGVDRAGDLQGALGFDGLAQAPPRGSLWHLPMIQARTGGRPGPMSSSPGPGGRIGRHRPRKRGHPDEQGPGPETRDQEEGATHPG